MDKNSWITVYILLILISSLQVSGWFFGDKEDENEIRVTTESTTDKLDPQLNLDPDDLDDLSGWRKNILVIAVIALIIGGSVALCYCMCKLCSPQTDETNADTQNITQNAENGDTTEGGLRDSFFKPPPRYSALIRSLSQRKARLNILRKKEAEEKELPRYSAAVKHLSMEDLGNNANTPNTDNMHILLGPEATESENNMPQIENNINERTPLNTPLPHSGTFHFENENKTDDNGNSRDGGENMVPLRHAASCGDLLDEPSPMHNVVMRKKQKQRTNSDPPAYSDYLYASTPKLA